MAEKYKIVHDRDICIGCSACASACDKYWKMNDADGKSDIIRDNADGTQTHAEKTGNGEEEVMGSNENPLTEDFDGNKIAAESCPVNCIHIHEVKDDGTDEKLI